MSVSATRESGAASAVWVAFALSLVLAVVGIVDQLGVHSLTDHATAMYAPYGKQPSAGVLYGLIYTVAVVGALLWLPLIRSARSGKRWASIFAVVVVVVTAGLAVALFAAAEYGSTIFPPLWGILAVLPPVAGIVATVLLVRRRQG